MVVSRVQFPTPSFYQINRKRKVGNYGNLKRYCKEANEPAYYKIID